MDSLYRIWRFLIKNKLPGIKYRELLRYYISKSDILIRGYAFSNYNSKLSLRL